MYTPKYVSAASIRIKEKVMSLAIRENYVEKQDGRSSAHHLISRCTAIPQAMSRINTTGMAATVRPNSAESLCRTMIRS